MKISQLITNLKEYQEKYGDLNIEVEKYDNENKQYEFTDISHFSTIDNSKDLRKKQETKLIIHI